MKIILKIFQIVQSHSRRRRFVPQRDHTLWTKVRLSSCSLMTDTTILQVRRERAQCPVYSQHRELDDLAPDRPLGPDPLRAHQWPLPPSRGIPRHPGGDGGIQDGESQSWLSGHLGCIFFQKVLILPHSEEYRPMAGQLWATFLEQFWGGLFVLCRGNLLSFLSMTS